jgi:hypothetical protein
VHAKSCEVERRKAIAGRRNGTEAINAFICIATVATTVKDSRCCLKALLDVLEQQRGLSGFNLVSDSEADTKAVEVAQYIACLLQAV